MTRTVQPGGVCGSTSRLLSTVPNRARARLSTAWRIASSVMRPRSAMPVGTRVAVNSAGPASAGSGSGAV